MRVVHFIWSLNVGGSETMLIDILREQARHDEIILFIGNEEISPALMATIPDTVRVATLKRPAGSRNPLYFFKLYLMMVRLRPDIIHTHHDSLIRLLPFVDAPKVLTVHATGIELTGHLAKYDQVFCISEAVRDDVFERYPGCVPVVVCNGVCASRFMQKNGQGSGDFRIVQISRLDHEIKGQDILIRAVSELGKMDGISGITLDFIGEGRSRGYLEKLADDCGISDKCRFLGEQTRDYIYSNLHTYDLLVQPSRSEGFGLTIAEGMAARVPVLVSRVAGPMEIIGQGDFGHSFESGNVQDCARRISSICHELRTGGLSTQIDKAHQHVVSRFDIGMTASAYRTEYLRIIGRHRRN